MTLQLDTSAYSAFKRGHEAVVEEIRTSPRLSISIVSIGELLAGFERGSQRKRNREELRLFLQSPRVEVAAVGEETAERYALIYASLREAGTPIPTNDLWIAACAMEQGAALCTLDKDFLRVAQIVTRFFEP
jgi:tRNA(fMet)-specific endonuclease VapC